MFLYIIHIMCINISLLLTFLLIYSILWSINLLKNDCNCIMKQKITFDNILSLKFFQFHDEKITRCTLLCTAPNFN